MLSDSVTIPRRLMRRSLLAGAVCLPLLATPARAADLEDCTPDIAPLNLAPAGEPFFLYEHRMKASLTAVDVSPSFMQESRVAPWLAIDLQYATKANLPSPAAAPVTGEHDLALGLREPLLAERDGAPVTMTLQEGLEGAGVLSRAGVTSLSTRLETLSLGVGHELGPVGLIGALRGVHSDYSVVQNRFLPAGGRLGFTVGANYAFWPYLAISGDWGKYFDGMSEEPAWGVALAGEIPYTPHRISIVVTDVPTTMEGGRGEPAPGNVLVGFSFSIAFTGNSRFVTMLSPPAPPPKPVATPPESLAPRAGPGAQAATQQAASVSVTISNFAFHPATVSIAPGTTVLWTNRDPIVHTATAVDLSWDTGGIAQNATASHTFTKPGDYRYICTPHPWMKGEAIVREADHATR